MVMGIVLGALLAVVPHGATAVPAVNSDQRVPTIIIDTRYSGCSTEEQLYYFPGKAERRAEKVKAVLRDEKVAFREVRWEKDSQVPDAEGIKALAPMKYFRNC